MSDQQQVMPQAAGTEELMSRFDSDLRMLTSVRDQLISASADSQLMSASEDNRLMSASEDNRLMSPSEDNRRLMSMSSPEDTQLVSEYNQMALQSENWHQLMSPSSIGSQLVSPPVGKQLMSRHDESSRRSAGDDAGGGSSYWLMWRDLQRVKAELGDIRRRVEGGLYAARLQDQLSKVFVTFVLVVVPILAAYVFDYCSSWPLTHHSSTAGRYRSTVVGLCIFLSCAVGGPLFIRALYQMEVMQQSVADQLSSTSTSSATLPGTAGNRDRKDSPPPPYPDTTRLVNLPASRSWAGND